MKVWVAYEATFDGGMGTYHSVRKVFDCEFKALLWVEEKQATDYEWRYVEEMTVE